MKLSRAREHAAALASQTNAFLAGDPFATKTVEADGRRSFVLHVRAEPPVKLAAIVGDAVHNLRSSLDLAVCELVTRNGGRITEDTAFPIVKERSGLSSAIRTKLKGATPCAVTVVRGLNPHRDGNPSLWRLHRLDILDKHRLLLVVGMAYRSFTFDPGANMARQSPDVFQGGPPPSMPISLRPADRQFPLTDGATLFSEPLESGFDPAFNFELALGANGVVEGEPIAEMLAELDLTVSTVLDLLEEC